MLEAIIFVVFAFCMAFAALTDLFTMTIANRVSLLLIGTFAFVAPLTGMDLATFGMHFAAGGIVLLSTFILFAMGGVGGGDAKLLSAIAIWCGFSNVLVEYMVVAALLGGYLTISLILWRGTYFSEVAGARFAFLERLGRAEVGVPYGIALGVAGLFTAPSMPLIKWAMERVAA